MAWAEICGKTQNQLNLAPVMILLKDGCMQYKEILQLKVYWVFLHFTLATDFYLINQWGVLMSLEEPNEIVIQKL